MSRELAVIATILAGGLIALQAPVNSILGRGVGTYLGVALSFAIGTVALVGLWAVTGADRLGVAAARELPWYAFTGGLLGAVYVVCALLSVRVLGAGGVVAATIAGQLAASVLLDRLGAFGLAERALTSGRLLGLALLVVGTVLVVRQ